MNPVTHEYETIRAEQDAEERATRPSALAHYAGESAAQLERMTTQRNALLTATELLNDIVRLCLPLMDNITRPHAQKLVDSMAKLIRACEDLKRSG